MRRGLKSAVLAAALCALSANAWAAGAQCARPQELQAIKTAAVQQELMVAALSCDAVPRYNQFVTAFQSDLQASDRALQGFFRRLNARSGTADYHAFKTRMANASSMKSIAHITNFCDAANAMFVSALDSGPLSLTAFLSAQPSFGDQYSVCENMPVMAREPAPDAVPPALAMIPRMKPALIVEPARGLMLRTSLDFSAAAF